MLDVLPRLYSQFLQTSLIEWIATISGFLCVYLASRHHILNWPISILSVSLYLWIFYQSKLYGDATLQVYFLSTAIYGWYYWNKRNKQDDKAITAFNNTQMLMTIAVIIILSVILGLLLDKYTDTDVPYIDAFCTASSLIAQFLLTRKVLQNWLIWLFVDICYVPLYIHKDLLLTALLYIAFAIIACYGYVDWRKSYRNFE